MKTQPKATYVPQLDGLRGLAVLMVFLHHAFGIPLLWTGVDLFFILSGYLITSILLRDKERIRFGEMMRSFYVRRAERILPAYILFLVIATLWVPIHWAHTWSYYAFFLQNVPYAFEFAPNVDLVPLWSLAVEQHFYLIWPVLVYLLPRRWLPGTMIAVLIAEPMLRGLCTPFFKTSLPIYVLTPFRLDTMAAGALAALWLPHCDVRKTVRAAQATLGAALLLVLVLNRYPWFQRDLNLPLYNSLGYSLNILVLGGLFVWTVLSRGSLLVKFLSLPILRGLGRISYMFYLLHMTMLQEIGGYLNRMHHGNHFLVSTAAFAATAVAATLSWFLVEKRVLSLSAAHRRAAPATRSLTQQRQRPDHSIEPAQE
jgi:peptidoglycan/LPS O-acetylase OafA/YrhL